MKPSDIKALRERLGMAQEQFAAFLGFSRPTITRWENGTLTPTPQHAELVRLKVAQALPPDAA